MNISEYQYLWNEERNDWVLVNTPYGYGIVNIRTSMMLMVSDSKLKQTIIHKMEQEGIKRYDSIDDVPFLNDVEFS